MRLSVILVCASLAIAFAQDSQAASSEQCLSAADLSNVGRMASVMAMGVAVQRCGECLGPDQYPQTLHAYDDTGLMADFWKAQKEVGTTGDKLARIDELMRDSARKMASNMSGNCNACRRTADTLKGLASADARASLYHTETDALAKAAGVQTCP